MTGTIDTMFLQMAVAPSWATTIAGFILVLAVIFLGVVMFGKAKQELGAFGISMLTLIGIILATILGLLPWYVLILFLVVALVVILFNKIFGGS